MKNRRIVLGFCFLVLLVSSAFAALPWGTRWESCHDDCDPQSGVGTCVLVRKLPPWTIWIVTYEDGDRSGTFHPAHDLILDSTYIPVPHQVGCSDAGPMP